MSRNAKTLLVEVAKKYLVVRMGGTISAIGTRLRTLAGDACRTAFSGDCETDAQAFRRSYVVKFSNTLW